MKEVETHNCEPTDLWNKQEDHNSHINFLFLGFVFWDNEMASPIGLYFV